METAHSFAFQKLDVYVAAKELAARVHRARIADTELLDQATRASKSAFLCLAEGLPNDGTAMRRKYFVMANNSLHEAVAAVDLAAAIGAIAPPEAEAIQALGLRVKRMLRALMRRGARRSGRPRLRSPPGRRRTGPRSRPLRPLRSTRHWRW